MTRNSPTSAWRRSMCSTRRAPKRLGAAYSSRAAAAAAGAAGAAEVAEAAEAVVDAAALDTTATAELAVCRGVLAASVKPDRLPIALTNADHFGRARQCRPGQTMCSWQCRSRAHVGRLVREGRVGLQSYREMPARELDGGIPVVEDCALHRRTRVAGLVTYMPTS